MSYKKYDNALLDIYQNIKWERKWKTLDISEKLELLAKLDRTIKLYQKMDRFNEVAKLTPELVMDHISERGFRRTRRLLEFCKKVEMQYYDTMLQSPDGIKEFRARFSEVGEK